MNRTKALTFVFAAFFMMGMTVYAQRPDDRPNAANQRPGEVLKQLGLTPAQLQQIREINLKRRPAMQQAQERVREAGRRLDEAIYADTVNETEVQNRLKEFHLAQAEVSRVRFTNEFAIRKVLNTEQLGKFRSLRQRFELQRGDGQDAGPAQLRAVRKANIRRMMRSGKGPF